MKFNMPTFRAEVDEKLSTVHKGLLEKINDKWYAKGNYAPIVRNDEITPSIDVYDEKTKTFLPFYIKISTMSINHKDILDGDNKPIFASLSKDGKGGDNMQVKDFMVGDQLYVCVVRNGCSVLTSSNDKKGFYTFDLFDCDLKVTGIQE